MRSLLIPFLLLFSFNLNGQNNTIFGKIIDENDEPLIGINVYITNNKSIGSVTDLEGKYEINSTLSYPITISISGISYESKKITIIVNDDENLHHYSKKRLHSLQKRFPESDDDLKASLSLRYFDPFRKGKKRMILHSKITIVDRKYALIGSANISRNALIHNYEIMLKIKGKAVSRIDDMLRDLSHAIKHGDDY